MSFKLKLYFYLLIVIHLFSYQESIGQTSVSPWPKTNNANKPWARWWWMGSAVDKPNLKKTEPLIIEKNRSTLFRVNLNDVVVIAGNDWDRRIYERISNLINIF